MKRRSFLIGAASLIAAPAIIRVADLMKISPLPYDPILIGLGKATPGHHWEVMLKDGRLIRGEVLASHARQTATGVYVIEDAVFMEVPDNIITPKHIAPSLSPYKKWEIKNSQYIPDEKLVDPRVLAEMYAETECRNPLLSAVARSPGSELYMARTDTSRFQQRRS